MTGMAALAICAAFTSCSKDTDVYNPNQTAEDVKLTYDQAFVKVFGQPAADQDWGFGTRSNTRGSEPNQTVWPDYGYPTKPGGLKATTPSGKSEEQIVTEWFQSHTIADAVTLDCNNYWVLQVHYKDYNYTANQHEWEKYENGQEVWKTGTQTVNPKGHMDQIYANKDANSTSYDHIYNFNTGSGDFMLVINSETKYGFGYEESWGTSDKHVYNRSFMAHIVDEANGIDGYYVGFDYQAYKKSNVSYTNNNGETITYNDNKDWAYEPDGIYDDRIIKIVPGTATVEPEYTIRVIGEDLTFGEDLDTDFDFNDVVFDVATNLPKTWIKIKAAGGTLPLIIGVENPDNAQSYDEYEIHHLLGYNNTSVMINTNADLKGLNSGTAEDVEIELTKAYANAKDIPVYVKKDGAWVELKAQQGEPASKLGVDTNFRWCNERSSLKGDYPLFVQWVTTAGAERVKWY